MKIFNKNTIQVRISDIYIYFIIFLSIALLKPAIISATIPQAAKEDPRYDLGYLVVTYYDGVNPDGTGDSAPGIQEAIYDAFDNKLVVLFPPGVYQVSDAIKCYYWAHWDAQRNRASNPPGLKSHALVGSTIGGSRPLLKLAPDADGYDDPLNPKPVVVWRYFTAINSDGVNKIEPGDPLSGVPENYRDQANVIFGWTFRNIDIDVNEHAGAIGGAFKSAQNCGVMNTRIDATNGYSGIFGVPGRNSFIANIEVEGGTYGIVNDASAAGSILVGAKLYNQSEYAILTRDFCPYSIVGFDIKCNGSQAVLTDDQGYNSTGTGTITLVDGKIEMTNAGTAIDNSVGKNIYLGNVYIKNSGNLLQSGSMPAIQGTGSWQHVKEYAYTDQNPASGDHFFDSYSFINGTISQDPEPSTIIDDSNPPENLVSRHSWEDITVWEGQDDGTVNVKESPYNAKGDGKTDDWDAIQTAINFAPEGKVFLPKGDYAISEPLVLKSNTHITGVGQNKATIYSTNIWEGGSGKTLVETVDDPDASTLFGFIGFWDEATNASNTNGGFIRWKAGRNSMVIMARYDKKWGSFFGKEPRYNYWYSHSAGGRHLVGPHQEEAGSNKSNRQVLIEGTQEPMVFYGLNVEAHKNRSTGDIEKIETNVEIINSKNIRIHSMKREGSSPSIIIHDSKNIGVYGMGRLIYPSNSSYGGYNQILGESDNILFATVVLDFKKSSKVTPILEENIDGLPYQKIDYPDCISLYKRGELTDLDSLSTSVPRTGSVASSLSLSCYPNPVKNELTILVKAPAVSEINIKIYNTISNVIFSHSAITHSDNGYQLKWQRDTSIPPGIYFVKLEGENFSSVSKIVL